MRVCESCHAVFGDIALSPENARSRQTLVCPRCHGHKNHLAMPDDICLLAELDGVNASIAEDILARSGVPFKTLSDFAPFAGQLGSFVRFYTTFEWLSAGKETLLQVFDHLL